MNLSLNQALDLLSNKLTLWAREFIRILPNIVLAAVILVVGFVVARFIRKIALKLIRKVSHLETINTLFSSIIYAISVGVVFFIVLSVLNLDKAVTSILAGAGILGLALAFAFQDIAANFMSGIFLSFRRPLTVGDIVKSNEHLGIVEAINLRDTMIRTFQGQRVIIPNKDVFQKPIQNFSALGKRRMDLSVGVSYGDDLQKVKEIAMQAAQKVSVRSQQDDITFFYEELAESSINFSIRIWMKDTSQPTYLQGRHEAILYIKEAFDANDIMIPYPIRTLDFGIKGGEKLSEMEVNVLSGASRK